jgi:hypothetical protein
MLGFFAQTIRETLQVGQDLKMLFGISFGYVDRSHPANDYRIPKAPLEESVTFHT